MHRRTFLAGCATLTAGVAGCGGSDGGTRGTETPQALHVPPGEYHFESGEDGTTVFVLTVENRSDERRAVTMVVTVRGPDEEPITESTAVDVPAGGAETYRVAFDIEWAWFDENRNLRRVEFESPDA